MNDPQVIVVTDPFTYQVYQALSTPLGLSIFLGIIIGVPAIMIGYSKVVEFLRVRRYRKNWR